MKAFIFTDSNFKVIAMVDSFHCPTLDQAVHTVHLDYPNAEYFGLCEVWDQAAMEFLGAHQDHKPEMPELSHEQEIEVGMAYAKREVDFKLNGDMAEQFNDTQPGDDE